MSDGSTRLKKNSAPYGDGVFTTMSTRGRAVAVSTGVEVGCAGTVGVTALVSSVGSDATVGAGVVVGAALAVGVELTVATIVG